MANPELSRRVDSQAVDLRVIGDTVLAVDEKVDALAVKVTALDAKVTEQGRELAEIRARLGDHGQHLREILTLLRQGR